MCDNSKREHTWGTYTMCVCVVCVGVIFLCLSLVSHGVYELCVLCRVPAADFVVVGAAVSVSVAIAVGAYSMHCTPLQLRAFAWLTGCLTKCEFTHTITNRTMWNNNSSSSSTRCVCFVRSFSPSWLFLALTLPLSMLSYRARWNLIAHTFIGDTTHRPTTAIAIATIFITKRRESEKQTEKKKRV